METYVSNIPAQYKLCLDGAQFFPSAGESERKVPVGGRNNRNGRNRMVGEVAPPPPALKLL